MTKNDFPIDIVIPWVDGSDKEWIAEFNKYAPSAMKINDISAARFRDYGTLRYWFRGIEKFAPWVRKVHFVTCGQKPAWLNIDSPKLHWVKHSDYIPKEYLPVFSSHPIELMMHRIPDLAEHFVYFNDDLFLISPVTKNFFFKNGLPCDCAVQNALTANDKLAHVELNNLEILNHFFSKKTIILRQLNKWFSPKYGSLNFRNIFLLPWPRFTGFVDFHFAVPYTKSLLEEVWSNCENELANTMSSRFRGITDINQWLFRYWQLCSGNFATISPYRGRKLLFLNDDIREIEEIIMYQKYKEIVLNDSNCNDYENRIKIILKSFETILPEKSSFEKC